MEKFFALVKLGKKYLLRYRKRYIFLFISLVFSFGLITFFTSSKDSMYDSVYFSAQSHYAGDIIAAGYQKNTGQNTFNAWRLEKFPAPILNNLLTHWMILQGANYPQIAKIKLSKQARFLCDGHFQKR